MSESRKVVDGKLEITNIPDSTIKKLDRDGVVKMRAEHQTVVDHLNLDLAAAEAVVARDDAYIAEIDN